MGIYQDIPDKFKDIAFSFAGKGEVPKISKPVLFDSKRYCEIVYDKKSFGIFKSGVQGRLIIDEQGNALSDKAELRSLNRLFYYYFLLFDGYISDIKKIIKSDVQITREEKEYQDVSSILNKLSAEGVEDVGRVKGIVDKFPSMRKEANEILKQYMAKIEGYIDEDRVFSEEILDELLPLYEKSQVMSFERVRFVNSASGYYDDVKREVIKRKKKIRNRINRKYLESMTKVENILSFYVNILRYYGELINYSTDRYRKFLQSKNNENVNNNFLQIRNK